MSKPAAGNNSNTLVALILLFVAMVLMPVSGLLGGVAQWIVICAAVGTLFLCAYQVNLNRRSGRP